ncbi:MAG: phosphoribosylglycinamide formyltransferase [Thiotrichaceae bacterium]|nr:phosphoribosylglycinamide formyltransferase [Thiotrichaceae bacterium]
MSDPHLLGSQSSFSIVVLISGSGSNLQALIDAVELQQLNVTICAVISNVADAYGLQRAVKHHIPTHVLAHGDFTSRSDFDQAMQGLIDQYSPDLIVLAGFMRLLTPEFVKAYDQRMINIHPSLLPKYRGLNTHQRTLESDDTVHGASVHYVTPELDSGAVILQAEVMIKSNDTEATLAKRVLSVEHIIYPMVIQWFVDQRLSMRKNQLYFDQKILPRPILYKAETLHFPEAIS